MDNILTMNDSQHIRALTIVFHSYYHHGIENYLNGLLPQLADHGIDATVLVFGEIEPQARSFLEKAGVKTKTWDLKQESSWKALPAFVRKRRVLRLAIRKVLDSGSYDVVHTHTTVSTYHGIAMQEAHRAHARVRIVHGHGAIPVKGFRTRVVMQWYRHLISKHATHILACSGIAGEDLYGARLWGKRGMITRNGIDTSKFEIEQDDCGRIGSEKSEPFVVGFVGRLANEKNPMRLLSIFAEVVRTEPMARLWIIGDGVLQEELEQRAYELGILDHSIFWGYRDDVPCLIRSIDCLVMPSFFEGSPLALLEAQASGLPCVISDCIDSETIIPGCPVTQLPLSASDSTWANAILGKRGARIVDGVERVRNAGFDVRDSALAIERIYRGCGVSEPLC